MKTVVIENGVVVSVYVGQIDLVGRTVVHVDDDAVVGPGYLVDGPDFVFPIVEDIVEEPSVEERIAALEAALLAAREALP